MNIIDLDEVRRQREIGSRDVSIVVAKYPDPHYPNVLKYRLCGTSAQAVDDHAFSLLTEAETFGNGGGEFQRAIRIGNVYMADGWTYVVTEI